MRLGKNEKMGPNSLRWSVQERVLSHPMAESLSVLRSECDRVRIELLAAREQAESKQSPFAKTKADREVGQ